MFVKSIKTLRGLALIGVVSVLGATNTAATENSNPTIPVTVNLTGVQIADGPIYISVQKREQYMGMIGHGIVLKTVTPGNMTATVNVTEPGDYSVSVWHDMDDDTVFDMDETYTPVEGWGASGIAPTDRMPTFDDVKITVESFGTELTIPVIYPS